MPRNDPNPIQISDLNQVQLKDYLVNDVGGTFIRGREIKSTNLSLL